MRILTWVIRLSLFVFMFVFALKNTAMVNLQFFFGQVWQLHAQGLGHAGEAANWTEWWVFWRRVAAGLGEEQQMQLLEAVAACLQ